MIAMPNDNANGEWSPYPKADTSAPTAIKFDRLGTSIVASYQAWQTFRTQNQNFVEAYLGPGYGSTRDKRRKYVNKSHQATVGLMMRLAANRPKVDVETVYDSLRPHAVVLEEAINHLLGEIHFEETMRRWVLDAYFQIGIVKVHRRDSGLVELEPNIWMDPGSPFASNVSLDDFACDLTARNWGEVKWAADMYRIPYRDIEEGVRIGMYDPQCAKELKPTSKSEGYDGERLERFGRGEEVDTDEFEPMVDLCDVWIASEQRIYTFPVQCRSKFNIKSKPIAVMDWLDPDASPYHILGFNDAPENLMPVSPASLLDEMDRLINNLMRKQARRAMNQKQGILFRPDGAETAKRIKNSVDDEMIQGDPESARPYSTGGIDPRAQGFLNECLMLADELGGNIKAQNGSGPMADTATQEQLIHAAGDQITGQMQSRVLAATRKLVKSLALELWQDEFKEIAGKRQVPGAPEYTYDVTWKPGEREGNFLDYNFDINVWSMSWAPPGAQLAEFMQLMQNFYLPLEGQIAAQGGVMNFALISRKIAEMSNKPWMNDLITFSNPPADPAQGGKDEIAGSKKPSSTTRNYTRTSVSNGGTPLGQQQARTLGWMGAANEQQAGMVGMGNIQ